MRLSYLIIVALSIPLLFACKKEIGNDDSVEKLPPVLTANHVDVNDQIGGFYSAVPSHYNTSSQNYPLIIFLHGGGQTGNGKEDLDVVLNEGIGEVIRDKEFPAAFTSGNKK